MNIIDLTPRILLMEEVKSYVHLLQRFCFWSSSLPGAGLARAADPSIGQLQKVIDAFAGPTCT
jgi:hypothetical protein